MNALRRRFTVKAFGLQSLSKNKMVENNENFNERVTASPHLTQQSLRRSPGQAEHLTCLQLFPCQFPVNSHMQNLLVRVATFDQGRHRTGCVLHEDR